MCPVGVGRGMGNRARENKARERERELYGEIGWEIWRVHAEKYLPPQESLNDVH